MPQRFDPDRRVVAVTGSSSFLGRELLSRLDADRRYQQILALDVEPPSLRLTKTDFHRIDLTQPNADMEIARLFKAKGVDTLVHLAFLSYPSHNATWAHELEAIGTLHVLNAAAACTLHKVVLRSLTALYGARPDNPAYLDEAWPRRGVSGSRFFSDKLEAERLTLRFAAENPSTVVTVLRTAPILGRRIDNYISRFVDRLIVPTVLGYDPLFQLLAEDDAIAALQLCLDADYAGIFNLAGEGLLPLSTLLAMAGKIPLPLPYRAAFSLSRVLWLAQVVEAPPIFIDFLRYSCVADTRRSRQELAFRPRHDIRDIIRAFADPTVGPGEQRS